MKKTNRITDNMSYGWSFSMKDVQNALNAPVQAEVNAVENFTNIFTGGSDSNDGYADDGGSFSDNDTNTGYGDWGGFSEQNDGWGE